MVEAAGMLLQVEKQTTLQLFQFKVCFGVRIYSIQWWGVVEAGMLLQVEQQTALQPFQFEVCFVVCTSSTVSIFIAFGLLLAICRAKKSTCCPVSQP